MVTGWGVRSQLATVLVCACMMGCGDGDDAEPETSAARAPASVEVTDVAFAPELMVDFSGMTRTPSGVFYQDVQAGRGAPAAVGQAMTVEYRAWLPDGTLFDERPQEGGWGAAEFTLGEGSPVPGLTEGMDGMRVGGVRRIVIPAEQGYGLIGRPANVPADSPLLFQVKLTRVQPPPSPPDSVT